MRKVAQILVDHMEIVEESRKLISSGNTIKWEELKKLHGKK